MKYMAMAILFVVLIGTLLDHVPVGNYILKMSGSPTYFVVVLTGAILFPFICKAKGKLRVAQARRFGAYASGLTAFAFSLVAIGWQLLDPEFDKREVAFAVGLSCNYFFHIGLFDMFWLYPALKRAESEGGAE